MIGDENVANLKIVPDDKFVSTVTIRPFNQYRAHNLTILFQLAADIAVEHPKRVVCLRF